MLQSILTIINADAILSLIVMISLFEFVDSNYTENSMANLTESKSKSKKGSLMGNIYTTIICIVIFSIIIATGLTVIICLERKRKKRKQLNKQKHQKKSKTKKLSKVSNEKDNTKHEKLKSKEETRELETTAHESYTQAITTYRSKLPQTEPEPPKYSKYLYTHSPKHSPKKSPKRSPKKTLSQTKIAENDLHSESYHAEVADQGLSTSGVLSQRPTDLVVTRKSEKSAKQQLQQPVSREMREISGKMPSN